MKKQRGQAIIEFALILPLFLLMIFGLIYSGMLFHDYSTLSNVARSAAREAAITQDVSEDDDNIVKKYYKSDTNTFVDGLITGLYAPKPGSALKIHVDDTTTPYDILVTITMRRNASLPWIEIVVPEEFTIKYHMRKDI